jgi:predicted regulator of Ras-like GTPase activity (Roadblock/LC7/MglB family)
MMNSPGKNKELHDLLNTLLKESSARTVLLISKEGVCIDETGDTSYINTTALGALVAGMFSATREVARMVGEDQFSILLQQGEKRHIHVSLLAQSFMMVVIFEDLQAIGRVRYESNKVAEKVVHCLRRDPRDGGRDAEQLSVPDFREYALNLIDRIFHS